MDNQTLHSEWQLRINRDNCKFEDLRISAQARPFRLYRHNTLGYSRSYSRKVRQGFGRYGPLGPSIKLTNYWA